MLPGRYHPSLPYYEDEPSSRKEEKKDPQLKIHFPLEYYYVEGKELEEYPYFHKSYWGSKPINKKQNDMKSLSRLWKWLNSYIHIKIWIPKF